MLLTENLLICNSLLRVLDEKQDCNIFVYAK